MQSSMHPVYSPPSIESPVKPAYAPEVSPAMAAKGLGDKFPYSGGAMALHQPGVGAVGTHSYGNGMAGANVVHSPRWA